MLISKHVEVRWNANNKAYYTNIFNLDGSDKYVFTKMNDIFTVDIDDLTLGSSVLVECECDMCLGDGMHTPLTKQYSQHIRNIKNKIYDTCESCIRKKMVNTLTEKHREKNETKIKKQKDYKAEKELIKQDKMTKDVERLIENALKLNLKAEFTIEENTYINRRSKLNFSCTQNEEHGIQPKSYSDIQNGYKCKVCARESIDQRLHDYETVKSEYENHGFTLLEDTYKSMGTPMKCICNEHPEVIQYKSFNMILDNRKCYLCSIPLQQETKRMNKQITKINIPHRTKSPDYNKWRMAVMKRDGMMCQCCKGISNGTLEVHHILNWSSHPELRFDIDNGITLCTYCHNINIPHSFHSIYGTYNNTRQQIEEYINNHSKNIHHIDPIIIKISDITNHSHEDTAKIINAMCQTVAISLKQRIPLHMDNFGTFYTQKYNNAYCIKFKEDEALSIAVQKYSDKLLEQLHIKQQKK